MRVVFAVGVASAIAVSLQGCGGATTTHPPSPAPTTPIPTTAAPPPAPPAPPAPPSKSLKPLRAIAYGSLPNRNAVATDPIPAQDLLQSGYSAQWSSDGRDDLGLMHTMGANAVHTYHSFGYETVKKYDHGKFLDRAYDAGVHVIAGYFTQLKCDNFKCFDSWKAATLAAYDQGFIKDGKWHPAVSMLSLMEEPDTLNFQGSTGADCADKNQNSCWLRAIISAMDGVLAAEKEKGIEGAVSGVNLTVAWSMSSRSSYDGTIQNSIGIYGFYDLLNGVKDPKQICGYTPVNDVKTAYERRWTNSINSQADWTFISGKILPEYKQFEPTPWFLSGYATHLQDDMVKWKKDLTTMDQLASTTSFLGVTLFGLSRQYQIPAFTDGLFALGKKTARIQSTEKVCREDVNSHFQDCKAHSVNCLCAQLEHGNNRAEAVAAVWGGEVKGPGVCFNYGNELCPGVSESQEATVV